MEAREKLIGAIYRVAPGTEKTRKLLTPAGILVFGTFTTLFILAAIRVDHLLHLPEFLPEAFRRPISIRCILLGISISFWSFLHFSKVKGTPVPFNPPEQIVKTGPYRYSRNPMITGVFIFLLGLGLLNNSFSLVFFFLPIFIILIVWELKHIEEPELIKRLGAEYVEYRRLTPMFFPDFRKRQKRRSTR